MGNSDWQIRDTERIITGNRALLGEKHLLVAMTRIRNEALILRAATRPLRFCARIRKSR